MGCRYPEITNSSELRAAYALLRCFDKKLGEEAAVAIKERIRGYHLKDQDRWIVKDEGIDGYVLLVQLPESIDTAEEAEEFFQEYEVMTCAPSMYDCTGQPFTAWYKLFRRRGRWYAYHRVAIDV